MRQPGVAAVARAVSWTRGIHAAPAPGRMPGKGLRPMALSPLAGKPAPKDILVDLQALERAYYARLPDVGDPAQLVAFGTSGHRGSSLAGSFSEASKLSFQSIVSLSISINSSSAMAARRASV